MTRLGAFGSDQLGGLLGGREVDVNQGDVGTFACGGDGGRASVARRGVRLCRGPGAAADDQDLCAVERHDVPSGNPGVPGSRCTRTLRRKPETRR